MIRAKFNFAAVVQPRSFLSSIARLTPRTVGDDLEGPEWLRVVSALRIY
jgi:hypothetical protein